MSELQARSYDNEDQERDASVYLHLLNSLTDLGISESSPKPNEYKIGKQWDQNRIFIRRVLRYVMPQLYDEKDREDKLPGLTLGKLIDILASLQDYWQKESEKNQDGKTPRIITQQEKQRVLRKYFQLLPQEREKLGLFVHPEASLLDQLKDTITDEIRGLSDIAPFYKQALTLYSSLKQQFSLSKNDESLENQIELYIQKRIDKYYQKSNSDFKKEKIIHLHLVNKVLREVSRTEFQAGIRQINSIVDQSPKFVKDNLESDSVSSLFLENLVDSIINNDLLSDEFPIYIDYVQTEKVKPLPLKLYKEDSKIGLINSCFLDDNSDENYYYAKGLEKQTAYKVKVYFYIYPPENWEPNSEVKMSQCFKQEGSRNRFEFCKEVVGIGSPISHISTAINKFLFEDIPILKDYLPVAQKILSEDKVVGNTRNSAVLSYSLVKLCKKEDIKKAIDTEINYDTIVANQELALGEYYGFDLLEAAAKSALYARLRAIKQTGINSQEYLQQLSKRIEEKYILKRSESYLHLYPFSLRAMQDYLVKNLFNNKYQLLIKTNDDQAWSLVAYEAHLKIIQTYLQEGLYRVAKKDIEIIKPHINDDRLDNKLLISLYYLCLFDYHFHTDFQDLERSHEQRGSAIRKAEECLDKAENILKDYLRDYAIIGEYSETNTHPFFYYLSRIYAHRAKIYIFFPYIAKPPIGKKHLLIEPIRLLEKARIYAARDGNPNYYAYWTVYQVWCYLIAAYLGDTNQFGIEFNRENCIQWSKRLIENAPDCYEQRGKKSYQQIKDNSGKQPTNYTRKDSIRKTAWFYEKYGDIFVQTIPPIIETGENSNNFDQIYRKSLDEAKDKHFFLELPMSVLTYTDKNSDKKIYLFGTYSSILLFGLGIVELCEDIEDNELESNIIMAMRRLTICAAIASEGTSHIKEQENLYLQRKFADTDTDGNMPKDFGIRGLYPHRLTHFTAQGKIFAAACGVILSLYNPQKNQYWQDVEYLLSDLHDTKTIQQPQNPDYSGGQTRYNGHLDEQFTRVKNYLEHYRQNSPKFPNLTGIRDKIVSDVFKILRGDKV